MPVDRRRAAAGKMDGVETTAEAVVVVVAGFSRSLQLPAAVDYFGRLLQPLIRARWDAPAALAGWLAHPTTASAAWRSTCARYRR
jgi:hypothetical protein